MNQAVFLDRDGVLNHDSPDFIQTPEELHVLPGAPEAVARFVRAGFLAIVVTNQSGISRGLLSEESLAAIHAKLRAIFAAAGGGLAAIYYCPHLPGEGCACRKPAPGMLLQAAKEHQIDLSQSWLVGDKPEDIACGAAAGCRTILVLTGQTRRYNPMRFPAAPTHICEDLSAAADFILGRE
ncbi:MAG TPA: D-glycero-beta-D-manno-heptose 1,7-bisphosphate 7-phosphatase [Chthonomonadales bacterium]|nr:D-glycero-beta-D-manno-heptose 1,7-bisphosphate 7-phosphatase [Chthonomonadales bacterium]